MFSGTIFAIVHGIGWPILAYIFGGMTNEFIRVAGSEEPELDSIESDSSSNQTLPRISLQDVMATYSLYYTGLGIVVFIASTGQIYCWQLACERQVHKLRKDFFYQVLRQQIGWFDEHESGGFSSKLNEYAFLINDYFY